MDTGLSLIIGPMFSGKCVSPSTLLRAGDGTMRTAKKFKIEDKALTPSGPVRIIGRHTGRAPMYSISSPFGYYYCTLEHELCLMDVANIPYTMSVRDFLELPFEVQNTLFIYKTPLPNIGKYNETIHCMKSHCYDLGLSFNAGHICNNYRRHNIPKELRDVIMYSVEHRLEFMRGCIDKTGYVEDNWFHVPLANNEFQTKVINALGGIKYVYNDGNIAYVKFTGGEFVNLETMRGSITGDYHSKTEFSVSYYGNNTFVGLHLESDHRMFDRNGFIIHNSTELIRLVKRFNLSGKKVLVLKSKIDDRYSADPVVVTHDKVTYDCIKIDDLALVMDIAHKYDVIAIDEGQFIKNLHLADKLALTHHVIIAGLDADFNRNAFKNITELIPRAEHVTKLSAICACGKEAFFTKKLSPALKDSKNEDVQIEVGSSDKYLPVCRNCH